MRMGLCLCLLFIQQGTDVNICKDSKIKHNKDQVMNSVNNELTCKNFFKEGSEGG